MPTLQVLSTPVFFALAMVATLPELLATRSLDQAVVNPVLANPFGLR